MGFEILSPRHRAVIYNNRVIKSFCFDATSEGGTWLVLIPAWDMLRNAIRFASAESFRYSFAICDRINLMPSNDSIYSPKWIERVLRRAKATGLYIITLVSRSYELGGIERWVESSIRQCGPLTDRVSFVS